MNKVLDYTKEQDLNKGMGGYDLNLADFGQIEGDYLRRVDNMTHKVYKQLQQGQQQGQQLNQQQCGGSDGQIEGVYNKKNIDYRLKRKPIFDKCYQQGDEEEVIVKCHVCNDLYRLLITLYDLKICRMCNQIQTCGFCDLGDENQGCRVCKQRCVNWCTKISFKDVLVVEGRLQEQHKVQDLLGLLQKYLGSILPFVRINLQCEKIREIPYQLYQDIQILYGLKGQKCEVVLQRFLQQMKEPDSYICIKQMMNKKMGEIRFSSLINGNQIVIYDRGVQQRGIFQGQVCKFDYVHIINY